MIKAGIPEYEIETIIRNTENIARWRQKRQADDITADLKADGKLDASLGSVSAVTVELRARGELSVIPGTYAGEYSRSRSSED